MKLSKYIDHTLLKADATPEMIIKLCAEAKEHDFKSVCVHPSYISLCQKELQNSDVLICSVVGFPLGMNTSEMKVAEAMQAIQLGADEIDMVINIGRLKAGDVQYVTKEITAVKQAIGEHILKVIIETCLLNEAEKIQACTCVMNAGADFVKTSTGFSTGGATFADVALLKKCVGNKALVKAAGGVRSHADFMKMISLGADRVGTSSGIRLLNE